MSRSLVRRIAFLLFVVFMTNIGAWGVTADRLKHELRHAGEMTLASSGHEHEHVHAGDAGAVADDDDSLSAAGHQLLHAVDHIQFFPDTGFHRNFAPMAASLVPSHFAAQALPLATFDPPFRPPSSDSLPA